MATVKRFLKQFCTYEKRNPTTDEAGNWTYQAPVQLRCRHTTKTKHLNNQKERTYVDVSIYWTLQEVFLGDRINGEEIMARKNVVDTKGRIVYWESNPRPPLGFTP